MIETGTGIETEIEKETWIESAIEKGKESVIVDEKEIKIGIEEENENASGKESENENERDQVIGDDIVTQEVGVEATHHVKTNEVEDMIREIDLPRMKRTCIVEV